MHILLRGGLEQRLRLGSGLILFAFALTHFLNHSLGLFSIDTMMTFQEWRTAVTRSLPGGIVLGLALLTHVSLALLKLARRSTFNLPAWELTQLLLGLAIPFLLFPHIVNTRGANLFFGVDDTYFYELVRLWPASGWAQSLLLIIVWTHACVGLHFWLRLTRNYDKAFPILLALAVLIPVTALAGFMVSGRTAKLAVADPEILQAFKEVTRWPSESASAVLATYRLQARYGFYAILAGIAAFVAIRALAQQRRANLTITYKPAPTVVASSGPTLLEISRMNGIPHLSVCGGRARCSTCRVEILEGEEELPAPVGAEAETLAGIRAGRGVRLACQVRPNAPLAVNLLLRAKKQGRKQDHARGVEKTLAVLFLDVRGFTSLSENKLPYDVVFILNRLFAAAGAVIQDEGGWIDKYLGDGLMAVFGRDTDAEDGCRRAIRAARKIDLTLDDLNRELQTELSQPLKIGIGLHVGSLVLGEIGHADTAALTVIGRTVNTASRLESASKDLQCQFVISVEAARLAGVDPDTFEIQSVRVRGLSEPLDVIAVEAARDLP